MKILPREEKFFELLIGQTRLLGEAATVLVNGLENANSQLQLMAPRIQQLEQEADEVVHEVYKRLNQTFITPLDPEDIHKLCSHLDDVMDGMEEAAHCIVAYGIDPIPPRIVEMSWFLKRCVAEITAAVTALDKNQDIVVHCIEINHLEDQVDHIVRQAIVDMFRQETDPIKVMKLKEVYDLLEAAVDSCEDVSDVLQNVVVKNS